MSVREAKEMLRLLPLLEKCRVLTTETAEQWREALRIRLAEIQPPAKA